MSRLSISAKLTAEMRAPAQPVQLLVSFNRDSNPPGGSVRDHTGGEHEFSGWLGLLRLLEIHCQHRARDVARDHTTGDHMSIASNDTTAPIALQPGQGEAIWFLGFLATIKASSETTAGAVAVIEHLGPRGSGTPLHVHSREDEWFYVTEGELTFWVGGQVINAPAGSFVYGPRGIPHTFTVSSEQARFLLVTEPAGFEEFMRALGEPATRLEIPPAPSAPPDISAVAKLAAEYGIEILGPPGIPA
jgi:quercetin dioxygenase-like cupin family protein